MKNSIKTLLLEDNPGDVRLIVEMLKETKIVEFEITTANRLDESLNLLDGGQFEMILLDLGLPDSQGLDTFRKVNSHAPGLPIIILTGLDDENVVALQAIKEGAQDYLIKRDLSSELLIRTIRYATERKQAEETLRISEKRLLKVQEIAKVGFLDWQFETNAIFLSDRIIDLYKLEPEKNWTTPEFIATIVYPDDLERAQKNLELLTKGKTPHDIDHRVLRSDGEIIWVHAKHELIYDYTGKPKSLLGTIIDITEGKQAEEALKDAELRYRTVADFTYDWEYWINPDGSLNYVSPSCEKITGYSVEQFIKNPGLLDEIMLSDDKAIWKNHNHDSKFRAINEREIQFRIKRKDGTIIWIEHACRPVFDEHGAFSGYRASNRDITERKQAEENLQKAHEELKELHKGLEKKVEKAIKELREKDHIIIQQSRHAAMGEMIGNIAHQWRQPLQAVAGIIQNFEDAFEDGTLDMAYIEKHTDKIMDILTDMSRTIDDFRFFFKPNKLKENFNVKDIIIKTIKFLESSFKFNNIDVLLNLADDSIINGFQNEYSQVVLILLSNAKDELVERNIKDRKVTIVLKKIKDKYVVTISDNAGGITEEVMSKIFDPYFTTKEQGKGTGVGLYMAKMIIEKNMDGKLSARNIKEGAEFRIEI